MTVVAPRAALRRRQRRSPLLLSVSLAPLQTVVVSWLLAFVWSGRAGYCRVVCSLSAESAANVVVVPPHPNYYERNTHNNSTKDIDNERTAVSLSLQGRIRRFRSSVVTVEAAANMDAAAACGASGLPKEHKRNNHTVTTRAVVGPCHDNESTRMKHQQSRQQQPRRNLQASSAAISSTTRRAADATGRVHLLVLLVRFSDHVNRTLPSREDIELLFAGNSTAAASSDTDVNNIIPTGSIAEYIRINSYGKLSLEATVLDWVTTNDTEAHYSFGNSGLELQTFTMVHSVLDYWYWNQTDGADSKVDWLQFDVDDNGILDYLVVLHSGFPAEAGGVDCHNVSQTDTRRIWSHAIPHAASSNLYSWQSSSTSGGPSTSSDSSTMSSLRTGQYMIGSALRGTCGSNISRIGVLTHELLHLFDLPDLYDTAGDWIGKGVGSFDIMGNPYGWTYDATLPSNVGPWTKMQLSWLNELTIINADGLYTVEPSIESPQAIYKIDAGFPSPNEFLLIENRQPLQWDASFPGGGGLVIWHIDNDAPGQRLRGHPEQDDWPMNGKHYQVAVLQADGRYDLELGNNKGDVDDFWVAGKELGPAPVQEYGPVTRAFHPSTNSYHYGRPMQTGIVIYDISEAGPLMSFRVSGISTAPSSSSAAPVTMATNPPSSAATNTITLQPQTSAPLPTVAPTTLLPTSLPTTLPPMGVPTTNPTTLAPIVTPPTMGTVPTPTIPGQTMAPVTSPTVQATIAPTPLTTDNPLSLPTMLPTLSPTSSATALAPATAAPTLVPPTPIPTAPATTTGPTRRPVIVGPPPRDVVTTGPTVEPTTSQQQQQQTAPTIASSSFLPTQAPDTIGLRPVVLAPTDPIFADTTSSATTSNTTTATRLTVFLWICKWTWAIAAEVVPLLAM